MANTKIELKKLINKWDIILNKSMQVRNKGNYLDVEVAPLIQAVKSIIESDALLDQINSIMESEHEVIARIEKILNLLKDFEKEL